MDKKQAIKIITDAIKIYDDIYCNRNLLIIFGNLDKPSYIEAKAENRNFFHLTGIRLNENHLFDDITDKNSNALDVFYLKAQKGKLSADDFEYKNNSTIQKLRVLNQTLKISSNAKMFGDFSGLYINLKTDKVLGSVSSFLGFIKTGKYYVPNTVMADDIRKNSKDAKRVLAVLSKGISEQQYNTILSVAKKIDIEKLLKKIPESIQIDNNIIGDTEQHQSQLQSEKPNNINQIKFDSPIKANNVRISGGTAEIVADPPVPNPFKGIFEKIKNGLSRIFKPKDKPSTPLTVQTEEVPTVTEEISPVPEEPIAEAETKPEATPTEKALADLAEAREGFIQGRISKDEYVQTVRNSVHTFDEEETLTQAAETLRGELADSPEKICGLFRFEIANIENIIKKKNPPKQTLRELEAYAHEQYQKQQREKAESADPPEFKPKSHTR